MAGLWGRQKREKDAAQDAADADLDRRAGVALVAIDERLRTTADELEFARIELGDAPTTPLAEGVEAVRTHLAEAYRLNQLNHDEIPDTREELRTRNARIVQLCEWAQRVLDERSEALEARVARARRAPEILAHVRRDLLAIEERISGVDETLSRLQERYVDDALRQLGGGTTEAQNLIAFARHSADISERRRAASRNEEANLALETATEAVRRGSALLDAIEDFELEALRAESTLGDVVADSRGDLIAARGAPQTPAVAAAAAALDTALRALPAPGARTDPFTDLSHLRQANAALDAAIATAIERARRPLPPVEVVRHAVADADHQLSVAGSLITGHRGWIGADARTRLAEAERVRVELGPLVEPEDTREQALQMARRAGSLAAEALRLAQRDIDAARPVDRGRSGDGGYEFGPAGSRRTASTGHDWIGGVIGAAMLGSIIGDIFD